MTRFDAIVVGSGAAGVHAAWALAARGLSVALVDYGNRDHVYAPLVAPRPWSELRRLDEGQHRYFLGDRFEGVSLGPVRVGAQLTPPRLFISADSERLLPIDSRTFEATQSLAQGGLASGWGAGVFPFDDQDLAGTPLGAADLAPHYAAVAERIGVSGARDDLAPYFGDLAPTLPPLEIDSGAEQVMLRYARHRARLNAAGFRLGTTWLAACSREHRGRGPHPYFDLDFWADAARAVYRPRWTLEELRARGNVRHLDRRLALAFEEETEGVRLTLRRADEGGREELLARALVLATGTLGTARIVLRSLSHYDRALPILCNPYTYVPTVNLALAGRETRDRRHSLAQLTAVYRPPGEQRSVQAQYYSYRSLLLFKLIKESPLAHRDSLRVLRLLQPLLGIVGVHHEDRPGPGKRLVLRRGPEREQDRLEIEYRPEPEEERRQRADERRVLGFFRRLGCWPLRRVRPGHGAAIHYAGTLPMRAEGGELTCDAEGRLRGTRAVYVADGSIFPSLPAKGLTFTIMAHADRVGTRLAERLA